MKNKNLLVEILNNKLKNNSLIYGEPNAFKIEYFNSNLGVLNNEKEKLFLMPDFYFISYDSFLPVFKDSLYFYQLKLDLFEEKLKNNDLNICLHSGWFFQENLNEWQRVLILSLFDKTKTILVETLCLSDFENKTNSLYFVLNQFYFEKIIKEKHLKHHFSNKENFNKWFKFNFYSSYLLIKEENEINADTLHLKLTDFIINKQINIFYKDLDKYYKNHKDYLFKICFKDLLHDDLIFINKIVVENNDNKNIKFSFSYFSTIEYVLNNKISNCFYKTLS